MSISLDNMMIFVTVAETKSFTKSAEILGYRKSRVSQIITSLENELNVKLLNRSTRKISLTEAGAIYLEKCLAIKNIYEQANDEIINNVNDLSGVIRIATPVGLKSLLNCFSKFIESNPNIKLEIIEDDAYSDLIAERCDLSVRIGNLSDSNMFALKIGEIKDVFCMRRELSNKIESIDDLYKFKWYSHPSKHKSNKITFYNENNGQETTIIKNSNIEVSTIVSLKKLLKESNAFAVIPESSMLEDNDLTRILPEYNAGVFPVNIVYNEKKLMPIKIRKLIDFLKENF